jgi:hypothetical protein
VRTWYGDRKTCLQIAYGKLGIQFEVLMTVIMSEVSKKITPHLQSRRPEGKLLQEDNNISVVHKDGDWIFNYILSKWQL